MNDEKFIEKYEELLDKGYCDCNEMNCLDNDVPRKILNIVKGTKLEAKQLLEENQQLKEQLKQRDEVIDKAIEKLKKGITFCENDSQGIYDKCNIAINRERHILESLQKYKGDNNE